MSFELGGKRVYVAGHRGMVGGALLRRLAAEDCEVLTAAHAGLDLRDPGAVRRWFEDRRPSAVFLAAARVGGIAANSRLPAEFLYDNLAIETAVIEAARRVGVEKLLFFGSACMYPRLAPQPMREDSLLTGPLEPTSEGYALAKLAGLKLCAAYRRQHGLDFVSVIPAGLYGPGDNFDPATSHVLAALLARLDAAVREGRDRVEIWGSGRPRREFLYVDDLADAAVFVMRHWSSEEPVNIGAGAEVTIAELAGLIARTVGFAGRFLFDPAKPDGAPRKALDPAKLTALGWRPRTDLEEGIRRTYAWYLERQGRAAPGGSGAPPRAGGRAG